MQRLLKINNKGFVLLETIVVVGVLCLVLTMMYASYNNIFSLASKKSIYNSTEYLYKANIIREQIEKLNGINAKVETNNSLSVYCDDNSKNCTIDELKNNINTLNIINDLGAQNIYIVPWSIDSTDKSIGKIEPSIKLYIKSLDPKITGENISHKRIIIKFKDENSLDNGYQIASLRFGGRD